MADSGLLIPEDGDQQVGKENPYEAILRRERGGRDAVSRSARVAGGIDAKAALEALRLEARTNVPPDVILRKAGDRLKEEVRVQDAESFYDRALKDAPATASWASDPHRLAAAREDLERLATAETILRKRRPDELRPMVEEELQGMATRQADREAERLHAEILRQEKMGAFGPSGVFHGPTPPSSPFLPGAVLKDPEGTLQRLREIRRENALAQMKAEEEFIGRDDAVGFGETVAKRARENPAFWVPFVAPVPDAERMLDLYQAAKAMEAGTASEGDRDLLVRFGRLAMAEERRGRSAFGFAGAALAELPAIAGEFALTAGAYSAGKNVILRGGAGAGEAFLKSAVRKALAVAVGGAAQTVARSPVRVAVGTLERLTPGVAVTQNDRGELEAILGDDSDTFGAALLKAVGSEYVETLAERSGVLLEKAMAPVKAAVVGRWLKLNPGRGITAALAKLKEASGWHGIVGEVFEERVGEVGRAVLGIEEYQPPSVEQLLGEAMAFAVPGAMASAASKLPGQKARAEAAALETKTVGEILKDAKLLQDLPQEVEGVLAQATKDTPAEFRYVSAQAIQEFYQGRGVDPRERMTEILGSPEAFDQALAAGGDVQIPTSRYAVAIAPTDENAFYQSEVRRDPLDMNLREVKEEAKRVEADRKAQEASAEAAAPSPEERGRQAALDASAARVRETVENALREAGFKRQARAYGTFVERAFRAFGERTGEDPFDLFQRYRLEVARRGEEGASAPAEAQTFDQAPVESEAFRAWYGESKVADRDGKPLPVYHGTSSGGFTSFDVSRQDKVALYGPGFYWTEDPAVAAGYTEKAGGSAPSTYAAYLSIKNPFRVDAAAKDLIPQLIAFRAKTPPADIRRIIDSAMREDESVASPDGVGAWGDNTEWAFRIAEKAGKNVEELVRPHFDYILEKAVKGIVSRIRSGEMETGQDVIKFIESNVFEVLQSDGANIKDVLKRLGFDGITHIGGNLAGDGAVNHRVWIAFEPTQIKSATGNRGTFDRNDPNILHQANRGRLRIGAGREMAVDLFKNADRSTFLHEMGHFYLEVLGDLAERPGAPADVLSDWQTVLDWLGVKSRSEITREHHEKWARGFEAYLMEGKAPSKALRKAFYQFKEWLVAIYREFRNLNVEITDDVRGVMDRLLASKEEIAAARLEAGAVALFADPRALGLTEEQAARYSAAVQDAEQEAEERLTARLLADLRREESKWWKSEREGYRKEAEAAANTRREYVALYNLRDGTKPDGSPLDDGILPLKLDVEAVRQMGFVEGTVERLPEGALTSRSEGGIHPDVAADMFGFEDGAALVNALANLEPKDAYVERLMDRRMEEVHGPKMSEAEVKEAAVEALHGAHREKVLRLEMELLIQKNLGAVKGIAKALGRRLPPPETVRLEARETIGRLKIREINPRMYQAAERRAAREAFDLFAKGDFAGAFDAKFSELLNHARYQAAVEAREAVRQALKTFRQLGKADRRLAGSRDVDVIAAGRAILAAYGIGDAPRAANYLKQVQQYDPDLFRTLDDMIQTATENAAHYKDATFDAFEGMKEVVDSLWNLSLRTKQFEVEGKKMDLDQVREELRQALEEFRGERGNGRRRALSKMDRAGLVVGGLKAWLRRIESWVDAMDDGNPQGLFRRYIWAPISQATTTYREKRIEILRKYGELVKALEGKLPPGRIRAPEIDYVFGQEDGNGVAELVGMLLHVGNISNYTKLVVGNGWGTLDEDGNLDDSAFRAFIGRMQREGILKKEHYDFAQSVWDLLESVKPDAQRAHRDMYGHYFKEITADPIVTPWGTYRGGYAPAIADRDIVTDKAVKEEKEEIERLDNSFMFPTTGRGFTKGRSAGYNKPLVMNLRLVPEHLDKVMRFTHIEPHVKDVTRLLWSGEFREALDAVDPAAISDMLLPWLQRAATQKTETPLRGRGARWLGRIVAHVRRAAGLQIMAGNFVNALQQFTGLSISLLKVKARYLRNAAWEYIRSPRAMMERIRAASAFMRHRVDSQIFKLRDDIEAITTNRGLFGDAKAWVNRHAYFLQNLVQHLVDAITWGGAYEAAIESGAREADAIQQADSAVRLTQSSLNPEDVSRFETGNAFARVFTMFTSYFNMQANTVGTEFGKAFRQKTGLQAKYGRAMYAYLMGVMTPAALSILIIRAMQGGWDDEDDDGYLDEVMGDLLGSQVRGATALIPGIGPVINLAMGKFTDTPVDDRLNLSPAVTAIEQSANALVAVPKAVFDDGDKSRAVKDALTLLGVLTGTPAGALGRPLGYLADVDEGDVEPSGPIDFTRGLIRGR